MKMFASFAALGATAALCLAQPALAQEEFSEQEVAALARAAMPSALLSLQDKCRPALPANAYIFASGSNLYSRLQAASRGAWPQARGAIVRMASRDNPQFGNILAALPPESLQPFVDEMVAGIVTTRMETARCDQIDRVLELLDPLPAENLAKLIGIAVLEAQKDEAGMFTTGLDR